MICESARHARWATRSPIQAPPQRLRSRAEKSNSASIARCAGSAGIAGGREAALPNKMRDEHVKIGSCDSLPPAFTRPKDWFGKVAGNRKTQLKEASSNVVQEGD
jgi:hypothetical protein